MADRGEHIEQLAIFFRCIAHTIGRDHRQTEMRGKTEQRLIAALLLALLVPLQFDIEIAAAIDRRQPIEHLARFVRLLRARAAAAGLLRRQSGK